MGSYDNIRFAYRMPNGFEGENYQTKSFDGRLDQYEVTTTGRLVRSDFVFVDDSEDPGPVDPPVDTHFSGKIYISDYCGELAKRWCFELLFFAGQLQTIRDTETDVVAAYDSLKHLQYALAASVSDDMLNTALSTARREGLIPEAITEELQAMQRSSMELVIKQALMVVRKPY